MTSRRRRENGEERPDLNGVKGMRRVHDASVVRQATLTLLEYWRQEEQLFLFDPFSLHLTREGFWSVTEDSTDSALYEAERLYSRQFAVSRETFMMSQLVMAILAYTEAWTRLYPYSDVRVLDPKQLHDGWLWLYGHGSENRSVKLRDLAYVLVKVREVPLHVIASEQGKEATWRRQGRYWIDLCEAEADSKARERASTRVSTSRRRYGHRRERERERPFWYRVLLHVVR